MKLVKNLHKKSEQAKKKSPRQFYLSRFDNDFKDKKNELERIIETEDSYIFTFSELNADSIGNALCNNSCNIVIWNHQVNICQSN